MKFNPRLLPLLVLLFVSLLMASGLLTSDPRSRPSRMIGKEPAIFDIMVVGQRDAHFSPTLWKGRVVVLNVFASWCVACAAEHPLLMKLAQTRKALVLGIAWKNKQEDIIKWINARGNPYQQIGYDIDGQTTVALGMTGVPETFVLDVGGRIVYNLRGPLTEHEMNTVLIPLLDRLNASHAPVR